MAGLRCETQFWLTAMALEALAESVTSDHVICRYICHRPDLYQALKVPWFIYLQLLQTCLLMLLMKWSRQALLLLKYQDWRICKITLSSSNRNYFNKVQKTALYLGQIRWLQLSLLPLQYINLLGIWNITYSVLIIFDSVRSQLRTLISSPPLFLSALLD